MAGSHGAIIATTGGIAQSTVDGSARRMADMRASGVLGAAGRSKKNGRSSRKKKR